MSEPEEERWKFRWEEVGFGANRDEALLNAMQWMDRHNPCGEVLLRDGEKCGFNRVMAAAAPELLAALKDLMELYANGQVVIEGDEGNDPVVGAAWAAINKAEGGAK